MTRVPRGGGSQEGTTGDLLSHQPEFMGTPLNYYELRESHQVSPRVRGEGHWVFLLDARPAECPVAVRVGQPLLVVPIGATSVVHDVIAAPHVAPAPPRQLTVAAGHAARRHGGGPNEDTPRCARVVAAVHQVIPYL